MMLRTWAAEFGIPFAAVVELERRLGLHAEPVTVAPGGGKGENIVQANIRYEAAQHGVTLWRNNVGALIDERGIPVRYGLANDSAALNKRIKSADLIGIRPVTIEARHVGYRIGQFVSREVKAPGWSFSGTDRELAQVRWAELIMSLGGDAGFVNGPGSF